MATMQETPIDAIPGILVDLQTTFKSGKTRDIGFRKEQLRQFWKLVDDNEADLRDALLADLGKPLVEATGLELSLFKNEVVAMLEKLDEWLAVEAPYVPEAFEGMTPRIYKQPKGICLVIGAWNYPFFLTASPFLGVIASGNVGVMKPSEVAPTTASLISKLVPKYLDSACYKVVCGGAAQVTALLDQQWDHILYTGGGRVGRIVMAAAAKNLTPVTLELGGKCPAIVTKNADVELAAKRIAWGKFACAGQTCVAPDYALVDSSVMEPFIQALGKSIQLFYDGNPQAEHKMGRIVNEAHWTRVTRLLASTEGQIVFGGSSDKSTRYIEPTVVVHAGLSDPLMQEEIFGPILPVLPVNDLTEACELVNRISEKPLGLYVLSEDRSDLDYTLDHTISGGVSLNDTMTQIAVANLPFGGVGSSGMGSYHGKASIDTFSHRRSVVHLPKEAEEAFEWRYSTGDQIEKFKFYKANFEAKL